MGDGVNIAARLEGVAAPGAICLSEDAYRQVKARLDLAVSDLGATPAQEHRRAGARLLAASRAAGRGEAGRAGRSKRRRARAAARRLPDKPSIAVLPFANMSGDAEQEYFADGISEDIITGSVEAVAAVRHRPQFVVHLQGQERTHFGEVGQEPRRALRPRRQRAQIRRPGQDDRAAHRRDDRRASVGRAVRPGPDRHLRGAGRRDDPHRLRARAQSQCRRPAKHRRRADRQSGSIRLLHARARTVVADMRKRQPRSRGRCCGGRSNSTPASPRPTPSWARRT